VNPDDRPKKWKEVEFKGEGNGVWGGGQVYLAYVKKEGRKEMRLMRISIAQEFLKVFLEDLSRLPPGQEVEVSIKILLGMAPMSQNPYRMTQLNC
jgi:hypothetical protein